MKTPLESLIEELGSVTNKQTNDEAVVLREVRSALEAFVGNSGSLDSALCQPHADHYVMYPVHIDPKGRFAIASGVWGVGQTTPIHDHRTWGVIAVMSGAEQEVRYRLDSSGIPRATSDRVMRAGDIAVCCRTDDDVHSVRAVGDEPSVSLHIYGADIATLERLVYDELTGETHPVVSEWAAP